MVQKTTTSDEIAMDTLIQDCSATLQKVARYKMPGAMDRRLLWLSENTETLTAAEREEMLALVDFSEDRTVEKLQARILLQRLADAWPQFFGSAP